MVYGTLRPSCRLLSFIRNSQMEINEFLNESTMLKKWNTVNFDFNSNWN